MPWVFLEGHAQRPLAAITANLHGDECTGIGVIRELTAWAEEHGLEGSLILYPSCNPRGLAAGTRHVPPDEADLNRLFPGNPRGTWASRLAATLWHDLTERAPDLLIDLHADAAESIPYVIVDRPVRRSWASRRALGERLMRLAGASGLTVLREYLDDVYVQFGLDRSLAGAVVNLMGKPAVTIECGPRRRLHPPSVQVALAATLGVLAEAGVVKAETTAHPSLVPGSWRRSSAPRSQLAGMLVPTVGAGELFEEGQALAELISLDGGRLESLTASEAGVLVSWAERCWAAPGSVLGTIGVHDGGRL